MNNKSTNKREKQTIFQSGTNTIKGKQNGTDFEIYLNDTKLLVIDNSGNVSFYGNIDFSNSTVTGLP